MWLTHFACAAMWPAKLQQPGSTAFTPGAQALKLLRHVQRRSRASAKRVRLRALERRIASDDMAALWSRDAARAQTLVRAHGALHKEPIWMPSTARCPTHWSC